MKVNVELLKNKLYLFQFTPAVQTTVSYEDGKGNTHTVVSNSDGSLALYEPNGIASDLRCASAVGDEIYRGTASMLGDTFNVNLKSGEGNGVYDELYPLNAVKLQPAASMELTIFKPDGTPLSNAKVTLRGGVYRNLDQVTDASLRDTAYCPGAKFSTTNDDTASLDGKVDQMPRVLCRCTWTAPSSSGMLRTVSRTRAISSASSLSCALPMTHTSPSLWSSTPG